MAVISGMPSCETKDESGNTLASFTLTSYPFKPPAGSSEEDFRDWRMTQIEAGKQTREAYIVAEASLDKSKKESAAFSSLQKAENARGSPDGESAYEKARVAYYTLTKGDTWLSEEQDRIANTEAQPVIASLFSKYNSLKERREQQQSTIDVMNGVKDRVLGVRDDLKFSVTQFQKQIGDIKNQINKDKRAQTEVIAQTSSWIDVFLNWLIAIVTIIAIFLVARRFVGLAPTLEQIETKARMMRAEAGLMRAMKEAAPPQRALPRDALPIPKSTKPTT
jgi:hypothetical protein